MEIKIMEWNINQRRNYSGCNMPEWIADVIGEEAADVVALTELYKGNNWESVKQKTFNSEYKGYAKMFVAFLPAITLTQYGDLP